MRKYGKDAKEAMMMLQMDDNFDVSRRARARKCTRAASHRA